MAASQGRYWEEREPLLYLAACKPNPTELVKQSPHVQTQSVHRLVFDYNLSMKLSTEPRNEGMAEGLIKKVAFKTKNRLRTHQSDHKAGTLAIVHTGTYCVSFISHNTYIETVSKVGSFFLL